MEYENNNLGTEIGWDDEISQESEYIVLDPGEYDFTVTKWSRSRFKGSDKIGPCNQVDLTLEIDGVSIFDRLFMNTKAEWRISQFFTSIGQKQPKVPFRPDWNTLPGSRGRCRLGIREWIGRDGETHKSNEVKAYLKPDPNGAPTSTAYQQQSSRRHQQRVSQDTQQTMVGYSRNPGHWQAGKF